ncbi:MAG: glycosyltransferase 61 family protein [Thermomicrobiales bacterium]
MVGSSDRGANRALAGSRPLQSSDFTFYGFGELRRDERRKILRLGIRDGEPAVSVIDDAVFLPNGYEASAGQPKYAGGIVKPDGWPIETAQMHRKGGKRFGGLVESIAVSPDRELDEEVIYLGLVFNHYGRVLLETLARIWFLKHVDPSVKVVLNSANAAQAAHAPWLPGILSLFGVPPERLLSLQEPTRLRRAIVPEPLFEQFYSAHEEMVRPFREAAARVAGDVTPSEQPLYLSRRRLSSRQRPVIGEVELEDVLRENSFLVAYPETMPTEDQVRLINSHTNIFSSMGSAAHSILFALHRPRLHLLASRDDIPANYYLCSVLAEAPTTFVNCLGSGGRVTANDERLNRRAESFGNAEKQRPVDVDAGPQSMPQLLDLSRAIDYLNENGFLKNGARSSVQASDMSRQRQFDEVWLYARIRKAATKSTLPDDIEQEAEALATASWPLSLMLARYYARARDAARADAMASQFVTLATAENDRDRLAYYRGDVQGMASRIARMCRPETSNRLTRLIADRFPASARDGDEDVD